MPETEKQEIVKQQLYPHFCLTKNVAALAMHYYGYHLSTNKEYQKEDYRKPETFICMAQGLLAMVCFCFVPMSH